MKTATLDNSRIEALATRPEATAAFPVLLERIVREEGCCRKRKRNHVDYDKVKRTFAALDPDGQAKLKELLGADKVTIYVPPAQSGGVVATVRF